MVSFTRQINYGNIVFHLYFKEIKTMENPRQIKGCRNIYSRIVYSRTIYPNIFTLRLNYSLGILPHGILILKYFYSVEIQFSGIFHPWTIYPKILCSMDQLSYGEFYLKFFCTKDFMSFRSLTLRFFWTLDYLPQDFVY